MAKAGKDLAAAGSGRHDQPRPLHDPRRRARRRNPRLPRRPPRRRRLRRDRRRLRARRPAPAGDGVPRPRDHRRRARGPLGPRPADARARERRRRLPRRSQRAGDRHRGAAPASSTASAPSGAAPTTSSPSRSPIPSCAAASTRSCAAPTGAATAGACVSRTCGSTPPRAPSTSTSDVLDLSAKEFALLRVLAGDPTRVFTKAELLRSIWGQRTVGTSRRSTRLVLGVGGVRGTSQDCGDVSRSTLRAAPPCRSGRPPAAHQSRRHVPARD